MEREIYCNKCAFLDKCKRVDVRGALALVAIYQKEDETNTEEEEFKIQAVFALFDNSHTIRSILTIYDK